MRARIVRPIPLLTTDGEFGLLIKVERGRVAASIQVTVFLDDDTCADCSTFHSVPEALAYCDDIIGAAKTQDPGAMIVLEVDPCL
ncbi:MAG: hypothetical protein JWM36_3894 [Hyphomicrobiales bacterium]|nr:hypothetical protein [Hyphomicrobiales bacterium]